MSFLVHLHKKKGSVFFASKQLLQLKMCFSRTAPKHLGKTVLKKSFFEMPIQMDLHSPLLLFPVSGPLAGYFMMKERQLCRYLHCGGNLK